MIKAQLASGVARKRVGLITTGAPARGHCKILSADGKEVGEITSGGFSPCLSKNIAMGARVGAGKPSTGRALCSVAAALRRGPHVRVYGRRTPVVSTCVV